MSGPEGCLKNLPPTHQEYTFYPAAQGNTKQILENFKKWNNSVYHFLEYNNILKNGKHIPSKCRNSWRLNNTLFNDIKGDKSRKT